ncbi:recombinase family protein [Proteus mirabilis]|uniref:recombinase family protein n=2 Tax=Gammaproteobacteria TaxID=1236 RepID=UPI0008DE5C74|nr:recombinase family protein [Proteus mirabilis]EGT3587865.1 helix-turn-helix domain-containing protein [Proteus mirabilis]MBC6386321.1 hypothetical protein [Proteus mirabilis]MBS3867451.1 recombinase family protein [Proteus mirabilis]MDC9738461.1 recombinase family protein [Proteus mirabilis]MDC9745220.1 recombinase family protein [Proteus mirabilis]
MKAKIGILSEELTRKRMVRIAEGKVTSEEPYPQFLFESLATLSQLLSNENVGLLNLIAREKPNSLDELAEMSGRSIKDLITLLEMFKSNGVQFKSLSENIDTTTSTGKLVFNVIGAIAEFERDIIVERTKAGLKAARARGRKGGRKQKLTDKQIKLAKSMLQDPSVQKSDVAKHFNISRPTLNRYLDAAPDLEQESLFK